jgi:hypothetical protein
LASVLDRSAGGDVNLKGHRHDEDVYKIRKLETVYFYPRPSYITKCLQLSDVRDSLEGGSYQEPVYLITGLKIAWGTTITIVKGRKYDGHAEMGVTAPAGGVDARVEAKASAAGETSMATSHTEPADFVLGIQVLKLYHKKKLFSSDRALVTKLQTKGAKLVDDDESAKAESSEVEDNFIIADIDEEDLQGSVRKIVNEVGKAEGVNWVIPCDIAPFA